MRGVIFAGGRGTRMNVPGIIKPLVLVGGRPIIDRVLETLRSAGLNRVSIVTSEYTKELESRIIDGIELDYLRTAMVDLAHAILESISAVHEDFLAISADKLLLPESITHLLNFASESESAFCVLVSDRAAPQRHVVYVSEGRKLKSILLSSQGQSLDVVAVTVNYRDRNREQVVEWATGELTTLPATLSLPDWEYLLADAIDHGLDVEIARTHDPLFNINCKEDIGTAESYLREGIPTRSAARS